MTIEEVEAIFDAADAAVKAFKASPTRRNQLGLLVAVQPIVQPLANDEELGQLSYMFDVILGILRSDRERFDSPASTAIFRVDILEQLLAKLRSDRTQPLLH